MESPNGAVEPFDLPGARWGRTRHRLSAIRDASAGSVSVAWVVAAAIFIFGSRHLLTRAVPVIGEIALLGDSPGALFEAWFSSWREAGLGSDGPAPSAYGILGVASSLFFGEMGLARTVLLLGLLPFGAAGTWRLLAPLGSRRVQIVGLAAYGAMPLPYNALANGVWSALALYGTLPWLCLWLGRVVGPPPATDADAEAEAEATAAGVPGAAAGRLWLPAVMVGALVGLLGAFVPVAPLAVLMLAVAVAAGGLLAGEARRLPALAGATVGGLLLGWLLNWPWAPRTPGGLLALSGARPGGASGLGPEELLRFATGPAVGASVLVWGLVAGGVVCLLVCRGSRFAWALRAWSLVLLSLLAALAGEHGWAGRDFPRPEVLLAPGAFGLALAIALGAAGLLADLPARAARWRILLAGVGLALLVAGSLPVLGLTLDGRWGMPRGDVTTPLATVREESTLGAFRIMWVGHADVLPLGGWQLDDDLVMATSVSGLPEVGLQWPGREPEGVDQLRSAWDAAVSGGTDRMGALLAPLGVRYVIVMDANAPEPFGKLARPLPDGAKARLGAQFDLERRDSRGDLAVYRNLAWRPTRTLVAGTDPVSVEAIAASTTLALGEFESPTTARGFLPAGSTLYLADAADGWALRVEGREVAPQQALGWARSFAVESAGAAELSYETDSGPRWAVLSQIALWLAVLVFTPLACLWRRRLALRPATGSAEPTAAGPPPPGLPPDTTGLSPDSPDSVPEPPPDTTGLPPDTTGLSPDSPDSVPEPLPETTELPTELLPDADVGLVGVGPADVDLLDVESDGDGFVASAETEAVEVDVIEQDRVAVDLADGAVDLVAADGGDGGDEVADADGDDGGDEIADVEAGAGGDEVADVGAEAGDVDATEVEQVEPEAGGPAASEQPEPPDDGPEER